MSGNLALKAIPGHPRVFGSGDSAVPCKRLSFGLMSDLVFFPCSVGYRIAPLVEEWRDWRYFCRNISKRMCGRVGVYVWQVDSGQSPSVRGIAQPK